MLRPSPSHRPAPTLRALQTKAVKTDDKYVINGTKSVDHQWRRGGRGNRLREHRPAEGRKKESPLSSWKKARPGFKVGKEEKKLGISRDRMQRVDLQRLRSARDQPHWQRRRRLQGSPVHARRRAVSASPPQGRRHRPKARFEGGARIFQGSAWPSVTPSRNFKPSNSCSPT